MIKQICDSFDELNDELGKFFTNLVRICKKKNGMEKAAGCVQEFQDSLAAIVDSLEKQKDMFTSVCDEVSYDNHSVRYERLIDVCESVIMFVLHFSTKQSEDPDKSLSKVASQSEKIKKLFASFKKASKAFVVEFKDYISSKESEKVLENLVLEGIAQKKAYQTGLQAYSDVGVETDETSAEELAARNRALIEETQSTGVVVGGGRVMRKRKFTNEEFQEYARTYAAFCEDANDPDVDSSDITEAEESDGEFDEDEEFASDEVSGDLCDSEASFIAKSAIADAEEVTDDGIDSSEDSVNKRKFNDGAGSDDEEDSIQYDGESE